MDEMKDKPASHPGESAGKTFDARSPDVPISSESCKPNSSRERVEARETKDSELKGISSKPSWLESGLYVPPVKRLRLPRKENVSKAEEALVSIEGKG